MHEHLRFLDEIRPLRDPVFLAAFSGWTDAPGAAASAIEYLRDQWGGRPIAEIDPEPYYDFTVQRPKVRNIDGVRMHDWPRNRFWVARPRGGDQDFVLFAGVEPHLRWRSFLDAMLEVMQAAGVTTSVTLGAQPGSVPHTRPLPINLSGSDTDFSTQFGLQVPTSRYEGPTGILSVLNLDLRARGWRNASLWVLTPHYLNVGPNPGAVLSLVRALDRGYHTTTPRDDLQRRIEEFETTVHEALDRSSEAATYIKTLEEQYDSSRSAEQLPDEPQPPPAELPSSDEILGDLERFLRQQRGEQ